MAAVPSELIVDLIVDGQTTEVRLVFAAELGALVLDTLQARLDVQDDSYRAFLGGVQLDEHTVLASLPWDTDAGDRQQCRLTYSRGNVRVVYANVTLPDRRLYIDLRAERLVSDLMQELRARLGYYVTDLEVFCRGNLLSAADPLLTVGASILRLNDVLQIARSSKAGVLQLESAAATAGTRSVDFHFLGQRFCLADLADTLTIAEVKQRVADANAAAPAASVKITPREVRLVQGGQRFDDGALVKDLEPVPVEVLRQWEYVPPLLLPLLLPLLRPLLLLRCG
jgi:hypothetical protein